MTNQNNQNTLETTKQKFYELVNKCLPYINIALTFFVLIFIILLFVTTPNICSQEKNLVSIPTSSSSKIVSIPLTVLIQALEQNQENFWVFNKNEDTAQEPQIEKDKEVLILLLKQNLEKQRQEGNENPQISINDLKSQIKENLKNNKDILKIVDNVVDSLESTTEPPLYTTPSPTN